MSQYMLSYIGGNQPATPEEGKQHFANYMAWINNLGDAAISPANPLKNSCVVNPDKSVTKGAQTQISGFTLIQADSLDAALIIAKSCPFLDIGGSLEVSEIIEMPLQK
jgi:hypothetical protein